MEGVILMKSKNKALALIALAIVLVIFMVVAFAVPFKHTVGFWIGFSFGLIAIIFTAGGCIYAMGRSTTLKSKFYGWPIIYIVWKYFVLQVICSFIFMGVAIIPAWIAVLISVILLALCALGLIGTKIGVEEIERIDDKTSQKVFNIKSLQAELECLVQKADDETVREKLMSLIDTVKYSDPMSNDSLASLESSINQKIDCLSSEIGKMDLGVVITLISNVQDLLLERNKKCLLLK